MRYIAVIFLIIFSLSVISGCGKAPDEGVDYKEERLKDPPEKKEAGEDVKSWGN